MCKNCWHRWGGNTGVHWWPDHLNYMARKKYKVTKTENWSELVDHSYFPSFNKQLRSPPKVLDPCDFSLPLLDHLPISSRGRYQHYQPENLKPDNNWAIQKCREGVMLDDASSGIISLRMTEGTASSPAHIHPSSEMWTSEKMSRKPTSCTLDMGFEQLSQTQTVMK